MTLRLIIRILARGGVAHVLDVVNRFRENHGYDFEDDVFQMWFIGEVARGRIIAPRRNDIKRIIACIYQRAMDRKPKARY